MRESKKCGEYGIHVIEAFRFPHRRIYLILTYSVMQI